MKISVLFVCDIPNWAFHNIYRFVCGALPNDEFDFYIDFTLHHRATNSKGTLGHLKNSARKLLLYKKFGNPEPYRRIRSDNTYDIVVLFEAGMQNDLNQNVRYKHLVKGIFTDSYPPFGYDIDNDYPIELFCKRYLSDADAVIFGCQNTLTKYSPYLKNCHYVNATLDDQLFYPTKRDNPAPNKLIVGWTGNPKRVNKGFYDYVLPAIRSAKQLRPNVILKTKFSGSIKELARFYDDVDVMLIASKEDTGPSMFMEASLSGVPSISTRIGCPLEVICSGENGLLVDRNVSEMTRALLFIYDHRELLEKMRTRIRTDYLVTHGGGVFAQKWGKMFTSILQ